MNFMTDPNDPNARGHHAGTSNLASAHRGAGCSPSKSYKPMNNTHHFHPGDQDFTPLVREALASGTRRGFYFAPGRYDFRPENAVEKYLFISNNDDGLKRIAFPLENLSGFKVEAESAEFVFHGGIVPFHLDSCADVSLCGFRIDWAVPFHCEGLVLDSDDRGVEIEIPPSFPFAVRDGHLLFGPDPDSVLIRNVLEFDARRRETAFRVFDNFGIGHRCLATCVGKHRVRLDASFREPRPQPGNILAILSDRRDFPAIAARACQRLTLRDVAIHHAEGMGFIAQHCDDIRIERLKVTPPVDGTRMISTTADATHFVNCRGQIELDDCLFENQMDDPTNIHGIYTQITDVLGPAEFEVRLAHRQQRGVEFAEPGELIEVVDQLSLATLHTSKVAAVHRLNSEFLHIRLEEPPSELPRLGDAIGNLTWTADATIRHCICRGNRARGFLLSTAGRIIVEENTLHSAGAAILIEGDANFWFESGAVRDVLIRRNTFEDCLHGTWGKAIIQVSPGKCDENAATLPYHRNIRIEDNFFRAFDGRIVRARGVDGLVIRGNRILPSANYPSQNHDAPLFDTSGCRGVVIENNPITQQTHVSSQPA